MGGIGWITKNIKVLSEKHRRRWLVANYEAGDVVFHSPYIIHASSSNIDPYHRPRLSADIRCYLVGARIDPRWEQPWNPRDGL